MSWFALALGAGLASAVNVFASKLLVGRVADPVMLGGMVHVLGGLLCLGLLPFFSPSAAFSLPVLLGVLGMGLVYTLGNALYFRALGATQLSEIDLFLRTSSLWTLLIGALLLGERWGPGALLGAALVLASVFMLARQGNWRFSRPQLLALGAAAAFGLGNVVDKALSPAFDALSYTALNLLLTGLGMLALSSPELRAFAAPALWGPSAWLVGLTFALTQLLLILAFQAGGGAGQVILVAQARLIVLVGVGVTLLGERDRPVRKALATLLMLAGIYALYR